MSELTNRHLDSVALHARNRPGALACRDLTSGKSYSYLTLDQRIDRCATWLLGQTSEAHARVSVLARNHLDAIVVFLACGRAGLMFHPLNFRLSAAELEVIARDAMPSLLLYDEDSQTFATAI